MYQSNKESFWGLGGWFSYPIVGCIFVVLSYLAGKFEVMYILNPSTLKGDDLIGPSIAAGIVSAVIGGFVAFNSRTGRWWSKS